MQKNKLKLYIPFRRSFFHKMTPRTRTPKSASFAPRPFSTQPSLLATTAHVISAPFECEHFTRQRLARTAEPSPTTLSSQTMQKRIMSFLHPSTSSSQTTAWVYTLRTHRSSRTHACCYNTIVLRVIAMSPAWAGQTCIVTSRQRIAR
jgi:hypothetical protein